MEKAAPGFPDTGVKILVRDKTLKLIVDDDHMPM